MKAGRILCAIENGTDSFDLPPAPPREVTVRRKRVGFWRWWVVRQSLLPLALVIFALAGGVQGAWSQGLVVVLAGWLWMWRPPEKSVGRIYKYGALVVLVALLGAFLPYALLGPVEWREQLREGFEWQGSGIWGMAWPNSLYAVGGLVVLTMLVYTGVNARPTLRERYNLMLITATLLGALGCLTTAGIIFDWASRAEPDFTFFEAYSQGRLFLAVTAGLLLAITLESLWHRKEFGLLTAFAALVCIIGLILMQGWVGLLLFLFYVLCWLFVRVRGRGASTLFRLIPLALLTGIFLTAFAVRAGMQEVDVERSQNGVYLLRDAGSLVQENWLVGVGAGMAREVFPYYREMSHFEGAEALPPSLWAYLAMSIGIPATLGVLCIVLMLLGRCVRVKARHDDPARLIILPAVLTIVAGTLVAREGEFLWSALLGLWFWRLALPGEDVGAREKSILLPGWMGRVVGSLVLLAGLGVLIGPNVVPEIHPETALANARKEIQTGLDDADAYTVQRASQRALQWNPLAGEFYLAQARTQLLLLREEEEAARLFRLARALDPLSVDIAREEGEVWLEEGETIRAIQAWQDALAREFLKREELQTYFLEKMEEEAVFAQGFNLLTDNQPGLRVRYLDKLDAETFRDAISYDFERDPALRHLPQQARRRLIERWAAQVSGEQMLETVAAMPQGTRLRWYYEALGHAAAGDPQAALGLFNAHIGAPEYASNERWKETAIEELSNKFYASPRNDDLAMELLKKLREAEAWTQLLQVSEHLGRTAGGSLEGLYWQGYAHAKLGEPAQAWEAWRRYLSAALGRLEGVQSSEGAGQE